MDRETDGRCCSYWSRNAGTSTIQYVVVVVIAVVVVETVRNKRKN